MNTRSLRPTLSLTLLLLGATAHADPPRALSSQEWEAQRARYTPATLPPVGPAREEMPHGETSTAAAGEVILTQCQPGGSTESVWRENDTGALWRLRTEGGLPLPPGVTIIATRCHARRHRLPVGERLAGTLVVSYPSSVGGEHHCVRLLRRAMRTGDRQATAPSRAGLLHDMMVNISCATPQGTKRRCARASWPRRRRCCASTASTG